MAGIFSVIKKVVHELQEYYDKTPGLVRYLPGIYHKEAEEKLGPLWALLHVMEHTFHSVEEKLDKIDTYFDIREAPANTFLPWLASWLDWELEPEWPEQKKRFALKVAPNLYKFRGTPTGMTYMLAFYFGIEVEIQEWTWPRAMQIGVQNTIGVNTRLHERPNKHHCFVLTWEVPGEQMDSNLRVKIQKIRALIDREKPAHTQCFFVIIRPKKVDTLKKS